MYNHVKNHVKLLAFQSAVVDKTADQKKDVFQQTVVLKSNVLQIIKTHPKLFFHRQQANQKVKANERRKRIELDQHIIILKPIIYHTLKHV